ncbi:ABC transporter substrate-binding protein [Maridesulfovibrio hydrothermalis]|uniref:ABC transporter substrate-binding protein n=1 Tax=Maridesulfovibrio hydrothermalis TaxID=191026 RepID=UPI001FE1B2BE|nr:ABC transporter substrate-binding protein [Maridesulfovibrio hydrothermalis]
MKNRCLSEKNAAKKTSLFARVSLSLLFFSTLLLCAQNADANEDLDKVTLQLKWFHQFQFAGYYAALEKGYYKDEGLDLTIIERDLKLNPIDQVLEGKADFGVSNSEILLHYLHGEKVVLLASIFQHSPLVFISKNSPLLHSPHDFIGKKVLLSSDAQDIELRVLLKNEGISLNDISWIDRFASPEDYFDPYIDVLAAYTTNQPFYFENENKPYSIIYPSTYGVDFYGDTLFTSQKQAQQHPERVRKFLRASLKGWLYALNHQDEIIDVIIKKFGSLKSKKHLQFEAKKIQKLILPDLVKIGHSNPVRWQRISDSLKKLGMISDQKELSGFFFDPSTGRFVVKTETALYVTALFSIIILILALTIYIARKLKKEINSRKIIETKLKKSEKYYRSLFENTGTATVILTEDFYIKHCNENFAELSGFKCAEIENTKKWTEFVTQDELHRMREYALTRKDSKIPTPTSYDFKFLRRNGEIKNIHVYVERIDGSTDRVASLIDMTEKVKTQELLIQTEKMLSVGGLAAGMAHEINNPLAGILQGAQNIKRRISTDNKTNIEIARSKGCSCEQINDYLEERGVIRILDGIKNSGERAATIVKNMLDFTRRNESGRTGCDINTLLDGIIDLISCDYDLRKKYDFKHTEIIKEYAHNLSLTNCYRIEIEQVFLNLVKNAAYAMYETSKIRPPKLTLRTKADELYTIIEIEDNGPGMSNKVKRRIFEPFFTTKSPGLGTGLGLSVSFFIITQNHKGIFEVDSELGKGSKFTIKIPKV